MNNPGDSAMQPGSASDAAEETKALGIIFWMTDREVSDGVGTDSKDPGSLILTWANCKSSAIPCSFQNRFQSQSE